MWERVGTSILVAEKHGTMFKTEYYCRDIDAYLIIIQDSAGELYDVVLDGGS